MLSGNRNFEGRVSPDVQANYLASPPLVVAHAHRRHGDEGSDNRAARLDKKGNPVYLREIWPTTEEINAFIEKFVTKKIFKSRYANVFEGDAHWRR